MLIDAGADVNAQGREYGNELQAASVGGQRNWLARQRLDHQSESWVSIVDEE
jgi:hypothetical protein